MGAGAAGTTRMARCLALGARECQSLSVPTYSYACTVCGHRFDIQQSFSDDALTECPECSGRLRKVFSAVGVVFKGSGFYRTDSRSGSGGSGSAAGSTATPDSGSGSGAGPAEASSPGGSDTSGAGSGTAGSKAAPGGGSSGGAGAASSPASGGSAAPAA